MKLICYLSNGYPSIEASIEMVGTYIEAGCDIIEVDFPSDDPYLDSPYIQNRMKNALEVCDDYDKYFDGISKMKDMYPKQDFIILIYEHTIEKIGKDKFLKFCKDKNMCDVIYVGDKNPELKSYLIDNGIKISCYVQFSMIDDEIDAAVNSNGFVYMQSKPGDINKDYPLLSDCINKLREEGVDSSRPIYCGVGVSTTDDIKNIKANGGDGAFVGSVILKLHDDKKRLQDKISELKNATEL